MTIFSNVFKNLNQQAQSNPVVRILSGNNNTVKPVGAAQPVSAPKPSSNDGMGYLRQQAANLNLLGSGQNRQTASRQQLIDAINAATAPAPTINASGPAKPVSAPAPANYDPMRSFYMNLAKAKNIGDGQWRQTAPMDQLMAAINGTGPLPDSSPRPSGTLQQTSLPAGTVPEGMTLAKYEDGTYGFRRADGYEGPIPGANQGMNTDFINKLGLQRLPGADGYIPGVGVAPGLEGWNQLVKDGLSGQYQGYRGFLDQNYDGGYDQWAKDYGIVQGNAFGLPGSATIQNTSFGALGEGGTPVFSDGGVTPIGATGNGIPLLTLPPKSPVTPVTPSGTGAANPEDVRTIYLDGATVELPDWLGVRNMDSEAGTGELYYMGSGHSGDTAMDIRTLDPRLQALLNPYVGLDGNARMAGLMGGADGVFPDDLAGRLTMLPSAGGSIDIQGKVANPIVRIQPVNATPPVVDPAPGGGGDTRDVDLVNSILGGVDVNDIESIRDAWARVNILGNSQARDYAIAQLSQALLNAPRPDVENPTPNAGNGTTTGGTTAPTIEESISKYFDNYFQQQNPSTGGGGGDAPSQADINAARAQLESAIGTLGAQIPYVNMYNYGSYTAADELIADLLGRSNQYNFSDLSSQLTGFRGDLNAQLAEAQQGRQENLANALSLIMSGNLPGSADQLVTPLADLAESDFEGYDSLLSELRPYTTELGRYTNYADDLMGQLSPYLDQISEAQGNIATRRGEIEDDAQALLESLGGIEFTGLDQLGGWRTDNFDPLQEMVDLWGSTQSSDEIIKLLSILDSNQNRLQQEAELRQARDTSDAHNAMQSVYRAGGIDRLPAMSRDDYQALLQGIRSLDPYYNSLSPFARNVRY